MKPNKFDGTGSLESFLAQFEVCARHNRWTAVDKVDFLRCSLDKAATQLLWDFGAHTDVTYEQLVGRLRQRYGAEGQAETFRAQLYYRRQRPEESLSDLLHDIRRLVVLAYPVPANETTEIVAKDAFLEAIRDKELSLKVREREPRTIDEAYRVALRLAAYQQTSEMEERRRPAQRVRGAKESDPVEKLQRQMEKFFNEQRKWQQDWETKMKSRLEEAPERQPEQERTNGGQRSGGSRFACYNCGRPGHIARNCRQRRNHQWQNTGAEEEPPNEPAEPPVTNNTTRVRPVGDMKNAVYVRCTINGRSTLGLVDTGSEVSLVPLSIVQGVPLQPTQRVLLAANATGINVMGELSIPVKMTRGFEVETKFLVSDQITDTMFGMDWLRQHRCRISFGTGALFIGKRRFQFVKGDGGIWCRRITVADGVTLPPRSQCEVSCNLQCRDTGTVAEAWMTEACEVRPGVHLARMILSGKEKQARIQVVNLGDEPAVLAANDVISTLHPVEIVTLRERREDDAVTGDASPVDQLLAGISEDVPIEIRGKLGELLDR